MRWSQLRKQVEDRFAPAVRGRVALHTAHYRHAHDSDGRAWIEVDGREVATMCYFQAGHARRALAQELRAAAGHPNPSTVEGAGPHRDAHDAAVAITRRAGVLSQQDFYALLHEYLRLPIDAALAAEDPVTRALAALDARTGKRRLRVLAASRDEHPLVRELLALRCDAEGISIEAHAG